MNKYLIFISLVLLFACKKKNESSKGDDSEIFIDSKNVIKSEDISHLIESIDILPLKETKGNFIGQAQKVIKTADHIIIFDPIIAESLVVFDNQGNFLKNVIAEGKGPGEAIQLNDCWLNGDGNLEIYDFSSKIIFTCNSDYDVIKETKEISQRLRPNSEELVGFKNYSGYNF